MSGLKDRRFFLLDKDGTLSLGDRVLDGTKEFITALVESKKEFAVATNNSSKSGLTHLKSFHKMGLEFKKENIVVSLDVAIEYLKKEGISRVFWMANSDVSNYLERSFLYDESLPEAILITFDTQLNYSKLLKITDLLHQDIPYYVTHSDIVCPTQKHDIPDVGTFIKLLEMTTGRLPDISFGKPSRYYIEYIKRRYKIEESDIVIVGDRLYTDIELAVGTDILSVLVLSGETSLSEYKKSHIKADMVASSISELIKYI
jgi:HAD superfamily hydrolase (TIGR01450 family)